MNDDWDNGIDSGKIDRFVDKNHWERSSSEPDLTDPFDVHQRFQIKNLHEHISVDELKFYRRKKPTDCHTKSSFCLYDQDKPELPFSILKTEYKWRYKDPSLFLRQGLTRKSTSLKLEGQMDIETEHKAKYLPYNEEQILKGRQPALRNPENLFLTGDFEYNPVYKSSFVHHPISERRKRYSPVETFKINGDFDVINDIMATTRNKDQKIIKDNTDCLPAGLKNETTKCHLKLEGEMSYSPEYRSQFVLHDVKKSHSIPQLSNLQINGTFTGIPEYRDSYKFYDNYSKSAPIKKADHLILNGQQFEPLSHEYHDKYKEDDKLGQQKVVESLKTEDHLKPEGEFSKDIPEYQESFKDPQVKLQMPEKGSCRKPYLRLKGKIEFNPEYRSTYLDHPRSRPICKKSTSSFRLSNNTSKSPFGSPRKRFQSNSPIKYHNPNADLPFDEQPEYRRAKYIYQIRERAPSNRQVAEVQGTVQQKFPKKILTEPLDTKLDVLKNFKKSATRRESIAFVGDSVKSNLENIENYDELLPATKLKAPPKYGRRASITRNAKNIREKSSIIEGNSKYIKSDDSSIENGKNVADSSFVVLNEPCKQNTWMKKSWYEN